MTTLRRITRELVIQQGWQPGTDLEEKVAFLLARFGFGPDVISQQYAIGRYRADFAHVEKMIVIEADGWHHRSPDGAAKDAERDSWMRSQGWLVLRVDDRHGDESLHEQVGRIIRWMIGDDWHGGRVRERRTQLDPRRACGTGWPG